MESNSEISRIVNSTDVYEDLSKVDILASGLLTLHYLHTERILQDNGEWEKIDYKNNSGAIIEHAVKVMNKNPQFKKVIEIVAGDVDKKFHNIPQRMRAISGGESRDWLFSGPIAYILNIPHISLYKQKEGPDHIETIGANPYTPLNLFYCIHFADLLNTGHSEYHISDNTVKGWVPMLRNRHVAINHAGFIIDLLHKDKETGLLASDLLKKNASIDTFAYLYIDEEFLKNHSKNPVEAIAYAKDARSWSEKYLLEHGALEFVHAFDPNAKKPEKAKMFMNQFGTYLNNIGRLKELEEKVQDLYHKNILEMK